MRITCSFVASPFCIAIFTALFPTMDAKVISENELLMAFAILGPLFEEEAAEELEPDVYSANIVGKRAVKIAILKLKGDAA